MDVSPLLKDLRLNKIRNIIIYASFITLIIALLFPLVNLENSLVQKSSLIFLIYGLFLWFLEHAAGFLGELADRDKNHEIITIILWAFFALLGFHIAFENAFDLKLINLIFIK